MLNIPQKYKSFKLIRETDWTEIFEIWKENEAYQESWKKHWEKRGFSSWEEWRRSYSSPLSPQKLDWFLYEIENPQKDFPNIFGVPSRSWIKKAYQEEPTKRLKDILLLPIVSKNPKIIDIKNNFPSKTILTGLIFQDKIILVEGMHRACALASWNKNKNLESQVILALAYWPQKEIPILGNQENKK